MVTKIRIKLRKHKHLFIIAKKVYGIFKYIKKFPHKLVVSYSETKKLDNIINDGRKRIWYFCVPTHPNLGDQAQAYCIRKWFDENYDGIEVIEIPNEPIITNYFGYLKKLQKKINKADLIFFQSGYTSTNNHDDEIVHRKISLIFKQCKIIFFPQTVLYTSEKERNKTSQIYKNHGNIVFLARDKFSYEIANKYFLNTKVFEFPDIVTSLIGKYKYNNKRKGILFCIRNDSEKFHEDSDILELRRKLSDYEKTNLSDTTIPKGNYDRVQYKEKIFNTIEEFSKYKLIITDRFHGTIFSLIASTPVIVLNTTDHKVKVGAEWFTDIYNDYVFVAEDLQKAYDYSIDILSKEYKDCLNSYFDQAYFGKLYNLIEED